MSVLTRVAAAWHSFMYGPDLLRRDAAGAQVMGGGLSSRAVWPNYDTEGMIKRAYKLAVAMACIDRIALDTSAAVLRVYREVDGQPEIVNQHAARDVIAEPNPGQSESEFWYFVVAQALTTGFCVLEKARSAAGRTVQLWPLYSPWVKVKPVDQDLPDWEYRVPGNDPWVLPAEDVIVITYRPHPNPHTFTGRSPLEAVRRELQIDDQLTDFLNVILERGGVGPIGLSVRADKDGRVKEISEAERDKILTTFQQRYGGVSNWDRPAFLGGLEVVQIGMKLGDMMYPEVRDALETHVCSVFGVPPGLIGTLAGLARNTFSNYDASVTQYYAGTISPLWGRLDGALTRGLLRDLDPSRTTLFLFDTSDIKALQEDDAPKHEQARGDLGAGLMTIDEARQHIGLAPLPSGAGDVLLLPFSATITRPVDLLAIAKDTATPPEPQTPPQEPNTVPSGDEGDAEGTDTPAERFAPQMRGNRVVVVLRPEYRYLLHLRSKKDITRLSKLGAGKLRTFWRKQAARIIGEVTREQAGGSWEHRAAEAIDWDEEETALAKFLASFYDLNGQAAYAAAATTVGVDIDWSLSNPLVRQLMSRLALRVTDIAETTREDVQRVVAEALTEGVTMTELADRLSTLFTETYRGRAMTVARTESQNAYNSAALTGYEETGLVAEAELLDNPDHGGYGGDGDGLTCAERDGLVLPLAEAQLSVDGTHPNCILAMAPVLITALGEE